MLRILNVPSALEARGYPPVDVDLIFKPETMQGVIPWLQSRGERIIYIYGDIDPWTAAALEPAVLEAVRDGDAIMVKGSLGSKMGPIVKALQRRFPSPAIVEQGT